MVEDRQLPPNLFVAWTSTLVVGQGKQLWNEFGHIGEVIRCLLLYTIKGGGFRFVYHLGGWRTGQQTWDKNRTFSRTKTVFVSRSRQISRAQGIGAPITCKQNINEPGNLLQFSFCKTSRTRTPFLFCRGGFPQEVLVFQMLTASRRLNKDSPWEDIEYELRQSFRNWANLLDHR